MNFTKNIGMLLLAVYLILAGLGLLVHTIVIPAIIMGILWLVLAFRLRRWINRPQRAATFRPA